MSDDIIDSIISADAGAEPAEPDEQQGDPSAPEEESKPQPQDDQGDGEDQEGDGEGDKQPEPKPVQKRINEITRARREAEARVASAEARAASLEKLVLDMAQGRQQGDKPQGQEATSAPKPPREEDYPDHAAFQEALLDYKVDLRLAERESRERQAREAEQRQNEQETASQEGQRRAAKMVETARAKFADFDDVVLGNKDLQISPVMVDAMGLEEKHGHDVAYYLGKVPEEAARIFALPPAHQVLEIGKLAAKIEAAGRKKFTKAPPPAKPLGGRSKGIVDESKLSDAEWMRHQEAKKRTAG